MATKYAQQQIGVADGTVIPANKADGREVNARRRSILASKVSGVAWANGDVIYLGRKPAGMKITDVWVNTGTSFGSSTIAIGVGTAAAPVTADKYVAAVTNTVTDKRVSLGPKASTLDDTPPDEEHLWATIGVADIVAGTLATIGFELSGQ
jgi:hypothetical protein